MKIWNYIEIGFATIGGLIGGFVGGMDGLVYALICFVVIDYITGVMVAVATKTLNSEVGFKGICRKVLIFLLVGIGNLLDTQVIGSGATMRTAVIFFYIANEGLSILENSGKLGLPIPRKLRDILEQLRDKDEEVESE